MGKSICHAGHKLESPVTWERSGPSGGTHLAAAGASLVALAVAAVEVAVTPAASRWVRALYPGCGAAANSSRLRPL